MTGGGRLVLPLASCCVLTGPILQELNVKLTKLGRQVEANQVALQEIKAALQ